jgi:hypothetical protein
MGEGGCNWWRVGRCRCFMEGECVHRLEADSEVAVDQEGGVGGYHAGCRLFPNSIIRARP